MWIFFRDLRCLPYCGGFESPNESGSCFQGMFDPDVDSWGKLVLDTGSESSK